MIYKKLFGHLNFNFSKYFINLIIDKCINIIFSLYIIKLLSEVEYGIYGFTISLSSYSSNLLVLGIATPIIVIIGQNKRLKNIIDKIIIKLFSISLIILFFLSVISFFFSNSLAEFFYGDSENNLFLIILLILILVDTTVIYKTTYNRLSEKFEINSSFILKNNLIKIITFIITFFVTKNFYNAFFLSVLFNLIYVFFHNNLLLRIKKYIVFSSNLKKFKDELSIIKEGIPFLIIYLLMNFSLYLVNFLLVNKLSIETYAAYNFNLTLAFLPLSFVNYIVYYSFPNYIKTSKSKKHKRNILYDILLAIVWLTVSFLFIMFFYEKILLILDKNSFNNFSLFMLIYLSVYLSAIINFIYFPLLRLKKYKSIITVLLSSISVNLLFLYFKINFTVETPVIGLILSQLTIIILLLFSLNEKETTFYSSSK